MRVTGVIQLQLLGDEGLRSVTSDPTVQQMSLLLQSAEELRGSVWALRTMPVAGRSFAESLEAIARQTGHGHAEHIAVRDAGKPVHGLRKRRWPTAPPKSRPEGRLQG